MHGRSGAREGRSMSEAAGRVLLPRKGVTAVAERLPRSPQPLPLELAVRPGGVVVRQGDPYPPMRVVSRGAFMVEVLRHDGRRLVLDVLGPGDGIGGPGDAVGAEACDGPRIAQATARAIGPGRLRAMRPGEEVPLLVRRAERAARFAADLAWFDVPTRLLARLNVLAERFGHPVPGGAAIGLRLRHDDLAALCGTSRESVTRAMSTLVASGTVQVPRRGRIVVRRPAGGITVGSASTRRRVAQESLPSWSRMRLQEPQ